MLISRDMEPGRDFRSRGGQSRKEQHGDDIGLIVVVMHALVIYGLALEIELVKEAEHQGEAGKGKEIAGGPFPFQVVPAYRRR